MSIKLSVAAVLAVLGPIGAAAPMSASPAAAAAPACKVGYTVVSQWSTGFQAAIQVTNLGEPVNGWTLQVDFPDPAPRVTQGWGASWSQAGARASAASLPWNASLGSGATVGLGFLAGSGQPAPAPAAFTLNGVRCSGATAPQPPTITLTYPTGNPDVAWGHDLYLAASAADPDGVVTKVEFYGGGALLFTDTVAPYEFTYTVRNPAGGLSLWAKAYDNDGATATSRTVSAFVFSPAETITGVVEAGTEAGCWTLVTDPKRYLLVGADPALLTGGARLRVRGTSRPDQSGTCQQETPFLVYSAEPA